MRASHQEQQGGAGASDVSSNFQRIGWGPVPNVDHDLGTDLLVQARDTRGFDRGLIIGVQVKAGPSYFDEPAKDEAGEVLGWWYRESSADHFDDWVTHSLPHLLVLHDLGSRKSYWELVGPEKVENTGKGCKLLVPVDQVVDESNAAQLFDAASGSKAGTPLEGSSFNASSSAVAPDRRLRYAMLAPRLVAPHRNRSVETLDWYEAVALVTQNRLRERHRYSEVLDRVPSIEGGLSDNTWGWKFGSALAMWTMVDAVEPLQDAFHEAPTASSAAASGVALSCALHKVGRVGGALDTLSDLIDQDASGPVDHAWLLAQRGRFRTETGDAAGAVEDSIVAQKSLLGDPDDVTASALAAATAWHLYISASSEDLASAMVANDTAVSWWRSQMISTALTKASEQWFRRWSEDATRQLAFEDEELSNLFAAQFGADLAAEHGAWRHYSSMFGRHRVMNAAGADDPTTETYEGLNSLRLSGASKDLRRACTKVYKVGPLHSLVRLLGQIPTDIQRWSHTDFATNVTAFSIAGDLTNESVATELSESCLMTLESAASITEVLRPECDVVSEVMKVLCALVSTLGPGRSVRVTTEVLGIVLETESLLAKGELASMVRRSGVQVDDVQTRDRLLRFALDDDSLLGSALLASLARVGDSSAAEEVRNRIGNGDLSTLSAVGDVTELDESVVDILVGSLADRCNETLSGADSGTRVIAQHDPLHALTLLNIWFPALADWPSALAFLSHQGVHFEQKRAAGELLLDQLDRVPEDVRADLAARRELLGSAIPATPWDNPDQGGLAMLLAMIGDTSEADLSNERLLGLAFGSAQQRRDLARYLGTGQARSLHPLLAGLLGDDDTNVRMAAARAVGKLLASTGSPLIDRLAQSIISDTGIALPTMLLRGLALPTGGGRLRPEAADIVAPLLDSPSANLRLATTQLSS